MSTRPVVRPIPSRDEAFGRAVREAVLRHWAPGCEDSAVRTAVIEALAPAYPAVTIRAQEPLASLLPAGTLVWYVRRDGRNGRPAVGPAVLEQSPRGRP